jgi:threonyl-tRNA synthetase
VQIVVMPITDRVAGYAQEVADKLSAAGLRVETDLRNEKINYKIREHQGQKLPYMVIVGDKEAEAGTVSVRTRSGDQSVEETQAFIDRLLADVKEFK